MKLLCCGLLAFSLLPAADPPRPKITGLANISLYSSDFKTSRAYYHDFLGFEEPFSLNKPDGTVSMTFFRINDRQFIELTPEPAPGTDRLKHFALETDDVEAMRLYLKSQGVAVPDQVSTNRVGNRKITITDPEGHSVEIVQYLPKSKTAETRGKPLGPNQVSGHMMHIGIIVTHFQAEMNFYQKILGFTEKWRGSPTITQLSWVNLKLPESADYIELMLYKEAPEPTKRGSAHHLCLEVPDVDASVASLKAKPYAKDYTRPLAIRTGTNRKRQINLFDPDGTRAELMEPQTIDGKPAPSSVAPPPTQ